MAIDILGGGSDRTRNHPDSDEHHDNPLSGGRKPPRRGDTDFQQTIDGYPVTPRSNGEGNWQADERNGVHIEKEKEKPEREYSHQHTHMRVKVHRGERPERERPRQQANPQRVIVNNRMGYGARSQPEGIDFGSAMFSGQSGAAFYSDPFRGIGFGRGGSLGFPQMSVGRVNGGISQGYRDPFAGSLIDLKGGIFSGRGATQSLSGGIFSPGVSLFGSPARAAPKRRRAPAKKARGKPALYGNAAASRKGYVQVNGKKVKVSRLPKRRRSTRR